MTYTTLISATDLRTHAGDANWLLVDCRHDLTDPEAGRNAYLAGHIPQARFAHLDLILSGAKTDAGGKFLGRHPLPQRPALIAALRELGINDHTQVIAYDAHGGMFAARLWWLLRWLGHAEVAVLDGGIAAWQAAGGTLTDAVTAPATPGTLTESTALVGTVNAGNLLENLNTATLTVIDARAADRFRGENETLDATGGISPAPKSFLQRQSGSTRQLQERYPIAQRMERADQRSAYRSDAMRLRGYRLPQSAGAGSGRPHGRASVSGFLERMEFRSVTPGGYRRLTV